MVDTLGCLSGERIERNTKYFLPCIMNKDCHDGRCLTNPMIIFKKQYEKNINTNTETGEELGSLLDEAKALVKRAGEGVKSDRAPITLVEKIQINDTVKLVQKLTMDLSKDISRGRNTDKNEEKLKKAVKALRTSIDNIL